MAVTVYQSTDAGAAALTLSGTAGDLVRLLDAVLINGYSGKAAAGWARPAFTPVTNKRVYRAASGNRYYLFVDDTGTITDAKSAYIRGYESMSAIGDLGTAPFPTVVQKATGWVVSKSDSVSALRNWIIIATPTFFYMFISYSTTAKGGVYYSTCFGDFASYKANDLNSTIIGGSAMGLMTITSGSLPTTIAGGTLSTMNLARKFDGIGTSPLVMPLPMNGLASLPIASYTCATIGSVGLPSYPDMASRRAIFTPCYIIECITGLPLRGWLPGLYIPVFQSSFNHGDLIVGEAGTNLSGKTLMLLNVTSAYNSQTGVAQWAMEISDTWLSVNY